MRLGLGVVTEMGDVMMGTGVRDLVMVAWTVTLNVEFFGAE